MLSLKSIDRVCVRLRALEDDVYQTRDLVEKWKRGWVLDRVWLPLRYTSKIDEKRARIEAHNVRIGQLLNADIFKTLHVDQPAAEAKYAAELKAKLDIHEEFLREDAQKKDQLLQEILEKRGKDNIFQAACSEDPQQWKAIEADLTKAEPKMTAHDASKLLQPYKDDIQSTQWKMAGPILCVDLRQGALSTMAQFHLEYLRLHAATGTQDFLTKRIEAAGYLLESDLTKRAIDAKAVRFSLDKKQVGARRALDCVEISYGKEATALEMIQLVKRLRNDREARGVKLRHFQDFDHILCFNEEAYTALIQLRQFAKTLHPANTGPSLKGWISLFPVQYSSHRVPQAFADVKMALNSFAEKELGWSPPANMGQPYARLYHHPYRARQFLIPTDSGQERDGNRLAVHKATSDIRLATGCVMLMAFYQDFRQGTLVTIVGPKDILKKAEEMVRAVCG